MEANDNMFVMSNKNQNAPAIKLVERIVYREPD